MQSLLRSSRPLRAQIVQRDGAGGFAADHEVAFLDAQHPHRLGAVDRQRVPRAGLDQRLPDERRVLGGDADLIGTVRR